MTFLNLLTNRVVVARLSAISGDKTAYATITAEYVCIQRMSDVRTTQLGGAIGKMFRLYAEADADIEQGDKLKDMDSGDEYKVTSVSTPASLGNFVHLECTIVRVVEE